MGLSVGLEATCRVVIVEATQPPCGAFQLCPDCNVDCVAPVKLDPDPQAALHKEEVSQPPDADPCRGRTGGGGQN